MSRMKDEFQKQQKLEDLYGWPDDTDASYPGHASDPVDGMWKVQFLEGSEWVTVAWTDGTRKDAASELVEMKSRKPGRYRLISPKGHII